MKRHVFLSAMLSCFLLAWAPGAPAEEARQIMWRDLGPPADESFSKLTKVQALQLSDVAGLRERKARNEALSPTEAQYERTATRKLEEAGFNVDALLAKRREYMEGGAQRSRSVNAALDGQAVRIPGYILPLAFSGKDITEFLLVPYVGACIHTPPPPPNQIVHVKSGKPIANVTVFSAVWVTGRLAAVSVKKTLSLVDGASDINVGYSLQASDVEIYKQ
ncbi:MAG TPA: DUF3299 domain-containing protein [Burkholderiales bacterium]|nr:DUF3299 domain-containing protein [Burkholderiales bacterium]